jgi:hypothetical protein
MRVSSFVLATSVLAPALASAAPIIGGTQAQPGQFPTTVALQVGQGLCTGTIITKDWVLTAAHCVTPSIVGEPSQAALTQSIRVFVGSTNINNNPGTVLRASDSFPHPMFNINALGSHDVGLIKLATPATVTPVPINFTAADAPVGVAVVMAGFGSTQINAGGTVGILMTVNQTSVSCNNFGVSDGSLLCFSQTSGKGKCEGDSGGPSFATVRGATVQVGITSFGDQSCSQFGADTRVDAEKDFIIQHIPELNCGMDGTCNTVCGMNGLPTDPDCPVCNNDPDCNDPGKICFNHQCVLGPDDPHGLGATCGAPGDCQSGACADGPGGMKCTQTCQVGAADACPNGFDCLGDKGAAGVCWEGGGGGGGCSSSGGSGAVLFGIGILGIVLLRRRV